MAMKRYQNSSTESVQLADPKDISELQSYARKQPDAAARAAV
jgi:hypothetical protein